METYTASFHGSDPHSSDGMFDVKNVGDVTSNFVKFYRHPVHEKDFCRIEFPGDRQKVWDQPVRIGVDDVRYHAQYQAYKAGKSQLGGQTELDSWGAIDPGSIDIYNSVHIRTVEALASLPDQNLSNLPAGHTALAVRHRDMARKYIADKQHSAGYDKAMEAAEQSQTVAKAALEENAELRAQLEELQRRMNMPALDQQPEYTDEAGGWNWPKLHKRKPGGWEYELSDGSIVVGKEAAAKAQNVLDSIG